MSILSELKSPRDDSGELSELGHDNQLSHERFERQPTSSRLECIGKYLWDRFQTILCWRPSIVATVLYHVSNGIYTGDILLPLNAKWNIDSYNGKGGFKSHHSLSLDHGYMSKWVMGAVSALDILALLLDGFGDRWLNVTPKERARPRPRTMWDGRQQGVHMARRFSLLVLIGLLSEWVEFLVQDRLDV